MATPTLTSATATTPFGVQNGNQWTNALYASPDVLKSAGATAEQLANIAKQNNASGNSMNVPTVITDATIREDVAPKLVSQANNMNAGYNANPANPSNTQNTGDDAYAKKIANIMAIWETNAKVDPQTQTYMDRLESMKASMDANSASQLATLQQQYEQQNADMVQAQKSTSAGLQGMLLRGGGVYGASGAPGSGLMAVKTNYDLTQLRKLVTDTNSARDAINQAQLANDYQNMAKQSELYQNAKDKQQKMIDALISQAQEQNKTIAEAKVKTSDNLATAVKDALSTASKNNAPSSVYDAVNKCTDVSCVYQAISGYGSSGANTDMVDLGNGIKLLVDKTTGKTIKVFNPDDPAYSSSLGDTSSSANYTFTGQETADSIAEAIKQAESGGASGETGPYQFMPDTWAKYSAEYTKDKGIVGSLANTPDNQDKVAKFEIQKMLDQGLTPDKIASVWNSGSPDYAGKTGTNSQGVAYDTPNYVSKVMANLGATKSPIVSDQYKDFLTGRTAQQAQAFMSIPNSHKDTIMQLINGDALMADVVRSRGGAGTSLINQYIKEATQVDPSFSLNTNKVRYEFLKKWNDPANKVGMTRNAINTALGHLAELKTLSNSLPQGTVQKMNNVENVLNKNFGDPSVTNFRIALNALGSELATAYKGGVPDQGEIKEWQNALAESFSKSQFNGAFDTTANLLSSKVSATRYQYKTTMGKEYNQTVIDPEKRQALVDAGIDPDVIAKENVPNQQDVAISEPQAEIKVTDYGTKNAQARSAISNYLKTTNKATGQPFTYQEIMEALNIK